VTGAVRAKPSSASACIDSAFVATDSPDAPGRRHRVGVRRFRTLDATRLIDENRAAMGAGYSRRVRGIVALVTVGMAAGTGGYILGNRSHRTVTARSGFAYASPVQAFVQSAGWTYAIPLDILWVSPDGTIHEGQRPSCLPLYRRTRIVFGSVDVTIGNSGTRSVVWVHC
jgi:hypothetical protein